MVNGDDDDDDDDDDDGDDDNVRCAGEVPTQGGNG